jgi:chemotaxis protein CheD
MIPGLAPEAIPKLFLLPCAVFAHQEEHLVTTLLGSCVAVCLCEPGLGIGGINHFMLPLWHGEGLATPKYGNVAVDKLVRRMEDLGCRRERLVGKVFGGASVVGDSGVFNIGQRNIDLALDLLGKHGIRVAVAEVGGAHGMKIQFNTRTGVVMLARIAKAAEGAPALPDGRRKN